MPSCSCGAWVSHRFVRVHGHPETGEVEGCLECVENRGELGGGADRI